LAEGGLTGVAVRSATESGLPGFADFRLDTAEDLTIRKPDSLFMEGTKPMARILDSGTAEPN
jgi:hypothetical protein